MNAGSAWGEKRYRVARTWKVLLVLAEEPSGLAATEVHRRVHARHPYSSNPCGLQTIREDLRTLRRAGFPVDAIAVDRINVNAMVVEASDTVIYYEDLYPKKETPLVQGAEPMETAPIDEKSLHREYHALLQKAVRAIENRQQRVVGASLMPMMKQLQSDFEWTVLGYHSFKEFIKAAEKDGVVQVDWCQ